MGWNFRLVRDEQGNLDVYEVYYFPPDGSEPAAMGGYHGADALPAAYSRLGYVGGESFEEVVGMVGLIEQALHRPILDHFELDIASAEYKRRKKRRERRWFRRLIRRVRRQRSYRAKRSPVEQPEGEPD